MANLKGQDVYIPGYPGFKPEPKESERAGGVPYWGKGAIKRYRVSEDGQRCVFWYDCRTGPGQSGSPIYVLQKDYKNPDKGEMKHFQIGVHVAFDSTVGQSVGTGLTHHMHLWMELNMREFGALGEKIVKHEDMWKKWADDYKANEAEYKPLIT